jgi:phage terminase Nu1 subunit (DNA packaging protein)
MAETRKRKTGRASEVAAILGVRESTVSRWKKVSDFPPATDSLFVLDDVFRWFYRREQQNEIAEALMDSQGGQSEGLERYRLAKAQMAEIELAKVRGEVVMMTDLEPICQAIFSPLRAFGEQLKRFGNADLLDRLEEANQHVLRGLEKLYQVNHGEIEQA